MAKITAKKSKKKLITIISVVGFLILILGISIPLGLRNKRTIAIPILELWEFTGQGLELRIANDHKNDDIFLYTLKVEITRDEVNIPIPREIVYYTAFQSPIVIRFGTAEYVEFPLSTTYLGYELLITMGYTTTKKTTSTYQSVSIIYL